MKPFSLLTTGLTIALLSVPVLAQDKPDEHSDANHHQKMWADLNLTDQQKTQLKDFQGEMKQARKEIFEKSKTIRDKIKEELLKQNPSRSTLIQYSKELSALEQSFAEKRIDHVLKMKQVLSAEQFSKFLDRDWMMKEVGPMHKGSMGGSESEDMKGCPHKGDIKSCPNKGDMKSCPHADTKAKPE